MNTAHIPLKPAHNAALNSASPNNFLRGIIERDLAAGTHATIVTRFPPEPNGFLHIGHAKSICLNFGLAKDFGGVCHLRFDDTNPEKESQVFADSIMDGVQWLTGKTVGASTNTKPAVTKPAAIDATTPLFFASDYFDAMHACAVYLIEQGLAYVDEQTPEQTKQNRGTLTQAGMDSPFRGRSVTDNLTRFAQMRAGEHAEGSMVLRAKIDMASPNMNMRDPAIYRIRHVAHHRTGAAWCIYPMYTFAHPIEDAIERITHSICTLEFEDQRTFYDWLLTHLVTGGLIAAPQPRQFEFARLNLTYVVTSKRKLAQLVNDGHVKGWDDPRMPTLVGLRRRGYTPSALQLFCERIGVSKSDSWIDYSTLEGALRDTLDATAHRAMAVLQPLKLIIDNFDAGTTVSCTAPRLPFVEKQLASQVETPSETQVTTLAPRQFTFGHELWIEQDDFAQDPPKGYHRLFVGNRVRLKYGFVVECTGFDTDAAGNVVAVHANYFPDSQSGTPTSGNYKVKGVIGWVNVADALDAEVRVYDRLFTDAQPDAGGKDFLLALNPNSMSTLHAKLEPSLQTALAGQAFQFERLGYFVADAVDHTTEKPIFNRAVGLKDTWKV